MAVCHAEHTSSSSTPEAGHSHSLPRIVLDRLHVLTGTPARPVQLADVEAVAYQAAGDYHAPIRLDPWQAIGLAQRLRARGVSVVEWTFSPVSVGRLAMTLHRLFREHRMALPDDAELLDEISTVRLRESTPGVYRLDHDASAHDDRAVAIGLAALALTERTEGRASISVPDGRIEERTTTHDWPTLAAIRAAASASPRGLRGLPGSPLLVPGSGNDPERARALRRRPGPKSI